MLLLLVAITMEWTRILGECWVTTRSLASSQAVQLRLPLVMVKTSQDVPLWCMTALVDVLLVLRFLPSWKLGLRECVIHNVKTCATRTTLLEDQVAVKHVAVL